MGLFFGSSGIGLLRGRRIACHGRGGHVRRRRRRLACRITRSVVIACGGGACFGSGFNPSRFFGCGLLGCILFGRRCLGVLPMGAVRCALAGVRRGFALATVGLLYLENL